MNLKKNLIFGNWKTKYAGIYILWQFPDMTLLKNSQNLIQSPNNQAEWDWSIIVCFGTVLYN